jgi:predicted permease
VFNGCATPTVTRFHFVVVCRFRAPLHTKWYAHITDCISYQNSGYFSLLLNDYLDQNNLHSLYNRFPTIENFEGQILEKQANYDDSE